MYLIACVLTNQISELAPDSLKIAASEEDSIIQLPSFQNMHDQSGQSDSAIGKESAGNSTKNSDHHSRNGLSAEPLMEQMIDLINLNEPAPVITSSDTGFHPQSNHMSEFEDNAFGEPDAFPSPLEGRPSEAVTIGDRTESAGAGYLDFSDSEAWEDSDRGNRSTHSLSSLPQTSSGALDSSGHQLDYRKDSTGVVLTGSVDWTQLISGLSSTHTENGNTKSTSIEESMLDVKIDGQASQTMGKDVPGDICSPFLVPTDSEVADGYPPDSNQSIHQSSLCRKMSRVESLRLKSQQQLEEMFASNLKTFDITTSAAAHPGSIPWILPKNPVKDGRFPGMPRPRSMVENRPDHWTRS